MHHGDAVGDRHHQRHAVLDQQQRGAGAGLQVLQRAAQGLDLAVVHAGRRFVQQHQPGLQRHGAGQFHQFLRAVGQVPDLHLRLRRQPELVQDGHRALALAALLVALARQAQKRLDQRGAHADRTRDQHVVEDRQLAEELQVLEGARDAQRRDAVRLAGQQVMLAGLVAEHHAALLRVVEAADAVQHRGLAGAVGADQRVHGVRLHLEADIVHGDNAAEGHAQALHRELGGAHRGAPAPGLRRSRLASPSGRNIRVRIMATP